MKPPVITESTCIRFPMNYLRDSGVIGRMMNSGANSRGIGIATKYLLNSTSFFPSALVGSPLHVVELNIRPGIHHPQKAGYYISTISISTDFPHQHEAEWYINEEQYIKSFDGFDLPIETFLFSASKDVEITAEFTINDIAEMRSLLTNL